MNVDDILDRIDWDTIAAAIRAEPLEHWGYEDAAKIVWNVATRFLPADLETYDEIVATEQHWALELLTGGYKVYFGKDAEFESNVVNGVAALPGAKVARLIHGYADLVAMRRGAELDVLDWKTAGELDKDWREKLADSWQWRLYCAVYGAAGFLYRGLDRNALAPRIPGQPYDWSKAPMKELAFRAGPNNRGDVLNFLATTYAMRGVLEASYPLGRWPRRMPDACKQYGSTCAYWNVCRDKAVMPEGVYQTKPFSHSGIGRFLNCPEHYRLATLTGYQESSRIADLGKATHRGTAALYDQFNRLKGELYGAA